MVKKNIDIFDFTKAFSYLIILLPIFVISGPFLSDLSISILAISSFFCLREKKFFNNYFFFFFIIFWILILCSSILSDNKILALKVVYFILDFVFLHYLSGGF